MRLLMVGYSPLSPETGGGQMVLHLASALCARGHEVTTWEPGPPPPGLSWRRHGAWRRRRLAAFLREHRPFDAIEVPPPAANPSLARRAPLIVRSVQPDWLYYREELARARRRGDRRAALLLLTFGLASQLTVVRGFLAADAILCLGSLELAFMRRAMPWTRRKLHLYVNAPGPADQAALAHLRDARRSARGPGLAWLWLGRWSAHKGIDRLLDFLPGFLAARPADTVTLAGTGEAPVLPASLTEDGRVRSLPAFSRPELLGLLASHQAGLFTSTVEGWGLSLSEMLESGMPVFATRAGAVPDLEPFFPDRLLPFPPAVELPPLPCGPLDLTSYYRRMSMAAIAEGYERQVLLPLRGGRP